jgi:ABC-type dipeptide/oligopeptide/nickel transport system permease component
VSATQDEQKNLAVPSELTLERYKYILQQIHTVNENLYRFLAIYQTLVTALVGAALALFVGYRGWHIAPATARVGLVGLLTLTTVVAGFTVILIVVGILTWFDYRTEECALTDKTVYPGFREPPKFGNFFRWYETYVLAFIIVSIALMWLLGGLILLPAIR